MRFSKIINFFLFINVSILFFGYLIGFNKSLWIDEFLSIIFGSQIPSQDIYETFTRDPHSPFYYFLLYLGQEILKLIQPDIYDKIHFLRIINLIGLLPIYFSYRILKKNDNKLKLNINIIFLLLISSNYFFQYILELRMYFLVLSFSLLINVINLVNTAEDKNKIIFFFASIFLSLLHIFGLTFSMSILVYRLIKNFFLKQQNKVKTDLIFIFTILSLFFIFYLPSVLIDSNIKLLSYISNNIWYYRVILEWTLLSWVFIFSSILLLFYKNKNILLDAKIIKNLFQYDFTHHTLALVLPAIILMVVVLSISFIFFPITHYRSLIVIFPNLALYGGLLSGYLFQIKNVRPIIIVFLIFLTFVNTNHYLKYLTKTHENIKWIISNSFTQKCVGANIYFNDNNQENYQNILKYFNDNYIKYKRPIKLLSKIQIDELNKLILQNANCNIFVFSFHTQNLENNLDKIKYNNKNFIIKYAPNVINSSSKSGAIVLIE
jgi:hypothetical protein